MPPKNKTFLVTGGGGFIGSHFAEAQALRGHKVVVVDNLSRASLMGKKDFNRFYNWKHLGKIPRIRLVRGDITRPGLLNSLAKNVDVVFHAAGQTAVTASMVDPEKDFTINALGTLRVLEAARKSPRTPTVLFCSTNKVYGHNVNGIALVKKGKRYRFKGAYRLGIPETFDIDLCEHTPYGASKLSGDLYMQDYATIYGIRTGVFRMSCIYGTRQFGLEDQGWLAWFTIATLLGKPITLYGDGCQVRDVLFVDDLIRCFDKFINSKIPHGVYNIGGGPKNTLSLLELIDILRELSGKKSPIKTRPWRPSDQKIYVSDIRKARRELDWEPTTSPKEGVWKTYRWVSNNLRGFR